MLTTRPPKLLVPCVSHKRIAIMPHYLIMTHTISIYRCTFYNVPEQGCCHDSQDAEGFQCDKAAGHRVMMTEKFCLCISRLMSSGCDCTQSDRHSPVCQEDLLLPPLLCKSTSFYSEYLVLQSVPHSTVSTSFYSKYFVLQ
jgi:hypothetical protein